MGGEKKEPLHKSFGYAWEGITAVIKKERNMKIHCCVMILVILAGIISGLPHGSGVSAFVCSVWLCRWKS